MSRPGPFAICLRQSAPRLRETRHLQDHGRSGRQGWWTIVNRRFIICSLGGTTTRRWEYSALAGSVREVRPDREFTMNARSRGTNADRRSGAVLRTGAAATALLALGAAAPGGT